MPFTAKEVHNAGIDGRTLKAAGFTARRSKALFTIIGDKVHTASSRT